MEWRGRRGSRNIEDRRRMGPARGAGIGGVGVLAVVVIGWFLGVDLTPLLQQQGGVPTQSVETGELTAEERAIGQFVSVTLADTEDVWADIFRRELDAEYRPPMLVLFREATQSPCGGASGATGPFYCPADRRIYLDTAFFRTLDRQLGAGGDFAAAYVVAHEVGHHVQNELGILEQTTALRQRLSEGEANAVSVRVELMADCLAGVWARAAEDTFGSLEPGDIDEAMTAASRIGDDTLQRAAGRRPMPDSFTHGTSEQRQRWFRRGFESGEIDSCDSFDTDRL